MQVQVDFLILKHWQYVTTTPQVILYTYCATSFRIVRVPSLTTSPPLFTAIRLLGGPRPYQSDCGVRPMPVCERFFSYNIDLQLLLKIWLTSHYSAQHISHRHAQRHSSSTRCLSLFASQYIVQLVNCLLQAPAYLPWRVHSSQSLGWTVQWTASLY